ncbi:hypothetical protein EN866_33375 [Mesorhizobium sp. M2D.F.Ca.ET.223.01.1.1]|uniref:hypothetical protein n=1 Tax=Mesorhizobium sp. M2D.F.Ca.ET.223.01.1.1 TaxID=2563940 RepID=UPI001092D840|nr:hypothetical protein [Mesorhizobium sp. M2D.F.Ca.ET.223.01.1.1]TGR84269.1 hypothetical protein EN866_33375 [Mesorhizobium sp. M2D.F.Ca.ET.223.01.1.1]TGT65319.1 hypothetical protein EN802_32080 [bacterium M00.F.Ca.ET.159.01.1.1]TGT79430.1 hypothetical protein EN800_31420 [bacterium M00.F.Ca.ET.157.01.1.1]
MKIRFKIGDACFGAAQAASGGKLNREEIEAAYQRMAEYKQTLQASGNIEGIADKLKVFAEKEAERTKIAAAMQRRHAALNILVRDRLDQTVTGFINAGMSPRKALLAVLEGTQKGVEGGRNSVGALNLAYEARYIGGLFGELQAKSPHLVEALRDPQLDKDIMREMAQLKEGGKPGITGNKDAELVAKTFATYAEMSRTDLNKLGASIGKLDGWAGAQTHDNIKMIEAGKEAWISSVVSKLDLARTFPEAGSAKDIEEALSGIYDTIVTGMPNKPTPREIGQRVSPANLAKSLGKSRVLHFKDAEAALAYRDEFGFGTTASGMVAHLRSAARMAANMEALGPNPEVMFGALVDGLKRSVKDDAKLSPAEKAKRMKGLTIDAGQLRHAIDISTGMISRPVDVNAAKIGGDIRAVQSLAKLGAALWSSMSDTVTAGLASQFRGSGFFGGWVAQIDGIMHGRPKGEQAEISYLLGEGFDGLIGHIVSPAAAVDGPVGRLSKMQETFFRWNGLSWWTDIQRASAGRMISAEMGMRAKTAFADLPANYRHVLGLHGISEKQWDAIRQIEGRDIGGRTYITPDMVRNLPDEAVAGLGKEAEAARHDLEMALHRFVADETSYGVIETDARSRRTTTWGTRPGTLAGEGIRFIMQFKGFPIAFSQRTIGRALFGFRQGAKLEQVAHIGTLIAGLTMAGYAAMTMKDLTKGYWPPRDPTDVKTWEAAFVQGGAAGIYGDYLFGRVNRFGSGLAETAMGPALGAAFDLGDLILKARDASISPDEQVKLSDWINYATQNTPFVNLYYVRPALDFLFLNSLREVASPGYRQKTDSKRLSQYGQQSFYPKSLAPFN